MFKKVLNVSNTSQENDIPTTIIIETADIFSNFIRQSFNNSINVCIFPASLKLANTANIADIFSEFQCGLRQDLSTQYSMT